MKNKIAIRLKNNGNNYFTFEEVTEIIPETNCVTINDKNYKKLVDKRNDLRYYNPSNYNNILPYNMRFPHLEVFLYMLTAKHRITEVLYYSLSDHNNTLPHYIYIHYQDF